MAMLNIYMMNNLITHHMIKEFCIKSYSRIFQRDLKKSRQKNLIWQKAITETRKGRKNEKNEHFLILSCRNFFFPSLASPRHPSQVFGENIFMIFEKKIKQQMKYNRGVEQEAQKT